MQRQGQINVNFSKIYDKLKPFQKSKPNENKFFYFPNILTNNIFTVSKTSLIVYPVLCSKADFERNDWFQLSQLHISKLSGLNINQVNSTIKDLCKSPLLDRRIVSNNKRRYYLYKVEFVRKNISKNYIIPYFPFYTDIIDTGVWADLLSRSKLLYLALRETTIIEIENEYGINIHSISKLCNIAKINRTNIKKNFDQLEYYGLVERINRKFKVYLHPKI